MSVSSIGATTVAAYAQQTTGTKTTKEKKEKTDSKKDKDTAVEYEKSYEKKKERTK